MLSFRRVIKVLVEDVPDHGRRFANFTPQRSVRPVAIRNSNHRIRNRPNDFDHGDINVEEVRRDFKKELKHEFATKGDIAETDIDILRRDSYSQARDDLDRLRSKLRKAKMYRKHFRDILGEKEVSVLTYAEKEKIKYLYSTNPEEWTPEALSAAFPISPDGVLKLVKSSFKARSIQDIEAHDKMLAARIDKINAGDIEMTPDLEEKMKMREQLPLSIGAVDPFDKGMLLNLQPVKFVGEFQRLVSPAVNPDSKTNTISLPCTNNGIPRPGSSAVGQAEPDLGDFYNMEPTKASMNELRKLKVSLRKVMTFDEFKTKMKLGGGAMSKDREIQHLSKLDDDKSEVRPTTLSDFENDDRNDSQNKTVPYRAMKKFQSSESTVMENAEGRGSRAGHKTQSEVRGHHFQEERSPERINIPNTPTKPDGIYQQGTSYYDDNGEFLYKVV